MPRLVLVQNHTKSFSASLQSKWLNYFVVCLTDGPVQWPCFFFFWSTEVCLKRNLGAKRAWPACLHLTSWHGSHRDNTHHLSSLRPLTKHAKAFNAITASPQQCCLQLHGPRSVMSSGYFPSVYMDLWFSPKHASRWTGWQIYPYI